MAALESPSPEESESEAVYEHEAAQSSLTIVASYRQQGNPLLPYLKELRVEFANIVPDYLLSPTHAAVFISLKFHRLHPTYLQKRVASLKRHYRVRLLLCLVDLPDFDVALESVTYLAYQSSLALLPAWSPAEAARILQTCKQVEEKPPDAIQARLSSDFEQRAIDILTTIPSITKVDCAALLREFGTFRGLLQASRADLARCSGIGDRKLRQLWRALHGSFEDENGMQ